MINATGNRMTMEIRRQSSLAQSIARSQINIATGRRIQQASDDPVASARVATLRRAQSNDSTWKANLELGASLATQADGVVRTMSENIVRAQSLLVSAASGTLSPADRQTIALELRGIADQFDEQMTTQSSLGQSLFHSNSAPQFRFSDSVSFAPVPDAASIFSIGGTTLAQQMRDAATAAGSGNAVAIGAAQTTISNGLNHVADVAAGIGVRAQRMEQMRENLIERGIEFAAERSGLEDIDLTEAIAQLNAQTLTLDAAQAAFARINRRSLIDILS
jgi:flagellar hook-associated protein 3 FlgL